MISYRYPFSLDLEEHFAKVFHEELVYFHPPLASHIYSLVLRRVKSMALRILANKDPSYSLLTAFGATISKQEITMNLLNFELKL